MNEDLRSRLNVMGNSMQVTITQIQEKYPGWASFLHDVFVTIGGLMEVQGE